MEKKLVAIILIFYIITNKPADHLIPNRNQLKQKQILLE